MASWAAVRRVARESAPIAAIKRSKAYHSVEEAFPRCLAAHMLAQERAEYLHGFAPLWDSLLRRGERERHGREPPGGSSQTIRLRRGSCSSTKWRRVEQEDRPGIRR